MIHSLIAASVSMLVVILMLYWREAHHIPRGFTPSSLRVQGLVLLVYVIPAAVAMYANRESLASVGITKRNLWQSLFIGLGLVLLTFFLQSGGINSAKLAKVAAFHGMFLLSAACVGFEEEFLFRGFLQGRLIAALGTWKGWALASFMMAAIHLPHRVWVDNMTLGQSALSAIGLMPVSLFAGFVMLRTRNLVATGLFHTFANLTS